MQLLGGFAWLGLAWLGCGCGCVWSYHQCTRCIFGQVTVAVTEAMSYRSLYHKNLVCSAQLLHVGLLATAWHVIRSFPVWDGAIALHSLHVALSDLSLCLSATRLQSVCLLACLLAGLPVHLSVYVQKPPVYCPMTSHDRIDCCAG